MNGTFDGEGAGLRAGFPPSQQVSWWPCYEFLQAALAHANCGSLPAAGTPTWCQLADGDPRKVLALAEFGVHHAVRVEVAQEQLAEASKAVAAEQDWPRIGRQIHQRRTSGRIERRSA